MSSVERDDFGFVLEGMHRVLSEAVRSNRDDWQVRKALLAAIHIQQRSIMDMGVDDLTIVEFDIVTGSAILDWIYESRRRWNKPIDRKKEVFRDE
jgi:hypothetical protein